MSCLSHAPISRNPRDLCTITVHIVHSTVVQSVVEYDLVQSAFQTASVKFIGQFTPGKVISENNTWYIRP